jgi:lysophospholipase L1-like esterase
MANRFVSVGDDLTLPADVKAADGNLPARLQDAALNATYAGRNEVAQGVYVPYGWGKFWRPKLAAAKAGTGKAVVAITGDSISEGYSASNLDTKSWAGLLRIALQSAGGDGGSGFKSMVRSSIFAAPGARGASIPAALASAYQANGNYWTHTGTWTEFTGGGVGPGAYGTRTIVAASKATAVLRGSSITFYTCSNAGNNAAWTYKIDGGAAVPVADGAGFNVQKTTVTGLSAGDHTVEVTYNGDGVKPLILLGASAENAQGVVVNNFSQYGQYTSTYGDITNLNPASWSGGSNYPADLVIYSLGLNNAAANFTADNFSKEVRKFFDAVRNGTATKPATGNTDILIVVQHAGTYDTNNVYQDYAVRRRGIAETYGAAIIDLWADGRNSWNYWNSLGYWSSGTTPGASGTDAVHLSDAGMQHVYDVVGPYVTATS